jgi:hypothetical protein
MITIVQYGNRYDIDTGDNRLHVLNLTSLTYHLKHVLGLRKKYIAAVVAELNHNGKVSIQRIAA